MEEIDCILKSIEWFLLNGLPTYFAGETTETVSVVFIKRIK